MEQFIPMIVTKQNQTMHRFEFGYTGRSFTVPWKMIKYTSFLCILAHWCTIAQSSWRLVIGCLHSQDLFNKTMFRSACLSAALWFSMVGCCIPVHADLLVNEVSVEADIDRWKQLIPSYWYTYSDLGLFLKSSRTMPTDIFWDGMLICISCRSTWDWQEWDWFAGKWWCLNNYSRKEAKRQ